MTGAEVDGTCATLGARMSRIPTHLDDLSPLVRDPFEALDPWFDEDVVVAGVGASAGPARLLAWALGARLGVSAEFAPISAFMGDSLRRAGRRLVLFSQGLSPNARLVLQGAEPRRTLLLTSVTKDTPEVGVLLDDLERQKGAVWTLPPAREDGLLLRVEGPAVALFTAAAWVESRVFRGGHLPLPNLDFWRSSAERARRAKGDFDLTCLDGPVAFVSFGIDPVALHTLRWKWLEGLGCPEPHVWDILEVAHGPLQGARERNLPFVAFVPDGKAGEALIPILQGALDPARQPLLVLRSPLRWPLAMVDFDLQLNALLLDILTARPRPLGLPAGPEEALYRLDGAHGRSPS